MHHHQSSLTLHTRGKGLYEITVDLARLVTETGCKSGLLSVFCCHTSCSLVTMENADPTAIRDLEYYLDRLVPDNDPGFVHTQEGPDDMPSHIKMALTRSSETIPFAAGRLLLGTWQGVFLWEHRAASHRRRLIMTVIGTS